MGPERGDEERTDANIGFAVCSVLPLALMKKGSAPKSRRRSRKTLSKKILVYFTLSERELIDKAADLERRSISSFVANAAIVAAEHLVAKRNH